MREEMRRAKVFLSFCLISGSVFGEASDHLLTLKSEFPYGLLGDDYGILTKSDLAINACHFKPKPYPPEPLIDPYEYWQCFESRSISLNCDSSGIRDDHEGIMGLVVVKTYKNQAKHEYIERRPWPIGECKNFLKDLRLLLTGTSHACISGSFIENETGKTGGKISSWLFERLKTSKGCEGRSCHFTEKIKQEYCSDLKS
ncbi:MAG: hypothetical protein HY074_04280 [Deltaproteobacteria bacterium]|nr:hypothetical protein [Deltaproteobacteria bacterium]